MEEKFVAYYRVSTKKQGLSGLGLDAQKQSVCNYISPEKIYKEFIEVESGKKNNRTELKNAIDLCQKKNYTLIIARLDRLSRNVGFITALMDSKVKFVCADMPNATNFTIHIIAALAEEEHKMISERTRKGLEQAKLRGKIIGKPKNLDKKAIEKGRQIRIENSRKNKNNVKAYELIKLLFGKVSLTEISNRLNKAGFKTAKNCEFRAEQVKRIYWLFQK